MTTYIGRGYAGPHDLQPISDPRVQFRQGLAQSMTLEALSIDAAVSGLMLNFVPYPKTVLLELLRVVKPGGTIGIFVWDYASGMQMLRYFFDAAIALNPQAREVDERERFWICREGNLAALMREVGLRQVEAAGLQINTVFTNFEDYWQPFLGGVGPGSAYTLSLNPNDRQGLRDQLQAMLPVAEDGTIPLTALAWAVRGIV